MNSDDKYVETVLVDDQLASKQEGSLKELATLTAAPERRAAPTRGAATADDVIKVAKFVWDIIKDSKAEAATESACTRVLSPQDENWAHYGGATDFLSQPVTYKLDNFAGVNCFTVKFRIAGTCAARHPRIGGQWMPNVHVTFAQCEANWPWQLSGMALINTTEISNVGSVEAPIPQIVLTIRIKADAKFAWNWESRERTFEFKLNARDGAQPVGA